MVSGDKDSPLSSRGIHGSDSNFVCLSFSFTIFKKRNSLYPRTSPFIVLSSTFLFVAKEFRKCLPSFTNGRKEFLVHQKKKKRNKIIHKDPYRGDYKNNNFYVSGAYDVHTLSPVFTTTPCGFWDSSFQGRKLRFRKVCWLANSTPCNRIQPSGTAMGFLTPILVLLYLPTQRGKARKGSCHSLSNLNIWIIILFICLANIS